MKAIVKLNGRTVGYLEKVQGGEFTYAYVDGYDGAPISRTFKNRSTHYHRADGKMFPFFSGLLSEGSLKELQCRVLKIDENDVFTRLVKTAGNAIGAVTVHPFEETAI